VKFDGDIVLVQNKIYIFKDKIATLRSVSKVLLWKNFFSYQADSVCFGTFILCHTWTKLQKWTYQICPKHVCDIAI